MRLVEFINSRINTIISAHPNTLLYGQNINAGSCLGGLTRNLSKGNNATVINSTNSENTLVGMGFGVMLNKGNAIFFVKQLDFLLLGLDQIVNTFNLVRNLNEVGSFTVFPITVDSGFEGPQASLNTLDDFASIGGVDIYSINNQYDANAILSRHLISPGFRIISTGQRLLRNKIDDLQALNTNDKCDYFNYSIGNDVTIVCFNHSLDYGMVLRDELKKHGLSTSLFTINSHLAFDYSYIAENVRETSKLIIFDDGKSRNKNSDIFFGSISQSLTLKYYKKIEHRVSADFFNPRLDQLEVDYQSITNEILNIARR